MDPEEKKKFESAKTITIASPSLKGEADFRKSFSQIGTDRTASLPSARKLTSNTEKKGTQKKRNPSARFSLEVIKTRASITAHMFQKKETGTTSSA